MSTKGNVISAPLIWMINLPPREKKERNNATYANNGENVLCLLFSKVQGLSKNRGPPPFYSKVPSALPQAPFSRAISSF